MVSNIKAESRETIQHFYFGSHAPILIEITPRTFFRLNIK